MAKPLPKCPKCQSTMIFERGLWHCLSCGTESKTRPLAHKFYEENKTAIIATYQLKGLKSLKAEWGIATSTWHAMRNRWGVPTNHRAKAITRLSKSNGHTPLPVWKDEWPEAVMLKWLEIYRELATKKTKKYKRRTNEQRKRPGA